ncbi:MAG: hypothetical protein NTW19_15530 [Planctomycetota bacterium]|nr:hypothetical protein [Planctomycetota bacterium]
MLASGTLKSFSADHLSVGSPMPQPDLSPQENLDRCVRDLYDVFAVYPLAKWIEPDGAFPWACDDRPLRASPLAQIPESAFKWYQTKAISSWGGVDDFKHFLPRIFDLIARSVNGPKLMTLDPIVFVKLHQADWRRWPTREQLVLDAYFDALWLAVLSRRPLQSECEWMDPVDSWLSAIAYAQADLTRFLNQWETLAAEPRSGLASTTALAEVIFETYVMQQGVLRYMEHDLDAQAKQINGWLLSDAVFALIEKAYFRWADTPSAELISNAHLGLTRWRRDHPTKP